MIRACVLLAPGFEEIEAVTVIDVLRRAGVDVRIAGVDGLKPTGSHGIAVGADVAIGDVVRETFDALVLPGGMPGAKNLRDNRTVLDMVRAHHAAGRLVAAICAAPIVLSAAGALGDRTVTSYPSYEGDLECAGYSHEPVVIDGNVTTSRGPATALAFALSLVEQLAGKTAADGLRIAMLA